MPLMSAMAKKLSWLSERSQVLAENVANADTPDYKAKDLEEVSFARELARKQRQPASASHPVRTNAMHLGATESVRGFDIEKRPDDTEPQLNGNTVGLEEQLIGVGQTQAMYQMTLNLYRKHMDMIRTAIGRAG